MLLCAACWFSDPNCWLNQSSMISVDSLRRWSLDFSIAYGRASALMREALRYLFCTLHLHLETWHLLVTIVTYAVGCAWLWYQSCEGEWQFRAVFAHFWPPNFTGWRFQSKKALVHLGFSIWISGTWLKPWTSFGWSVSTIVCVAAHLSARFRHLGRSAGCPKNGHWTSLLVSPPAGCFAAQPRFDRVLKHGIIGMAALANMRDVTTCAWLASLKSTHRELAS